MTVNNSGEQCNRLMLSSADVWSNSGGRTVTVIDEKYYADILQWVVRAHGVATEPLIVVGDSNVDDRVCADNVVDVKPLKCELVGGFEVDDRFYRTPKQAYREDCLRRGDRFRMRREKFQRKK